MDGKISITLGFVIPRNENRLSFLCLADGNDNGEEGGYRSQFSSSEFVIPKLYRRFCEPLTKPGQPQFTLTNSIQLPGTAI